MSHTGGKHFLGRENILVVAYKEKGVLPLPREIILTLFQDSVTSSKLLALSPNTYGLFLT